MMNDKDIGRASARVLHSRLDEVYSGDPALRPRSEMHDYQLTYPPAVALERPEFRTTPSAEEFTEHGVGDFRNAAYYFHFGFCAYRCNYCYHYEIRNNRNFELMERYVKAMEREMAWVRARTKATRQSLYFLGGGTPTAIPLPLIEQFLDTLTTTFGPPGSIMSTVEAKPITASTDKMMAYIQAGFRRINLGVQTLDPDIYALHHHGEELSVAIDAIHRARRCGYEYINIDIMTGLQHQTPESWAMTLDTIKWLGTSGAVDSVFIYPYHDDPRSPTYNKPQLLPSPVETAHSDAQARAMFQRMGWKELGPRFYRSPRHVRRELRELIRLRVNPSYGEVLYHGFGNSSFSIGDRSTYLNHRSVPDYCDAVEESGIGVSHWTKLDRYQRATRDLTFDILYSPIIPVRSISKKYGADTMVGHKALLHRWTELGLGKWNRLLGTWHLTNLGKLVHQQMLPVLYRPIDGERFSETMEKRRVMGRKYRGY